MDDVYPLTSKVNFVSSAGCMSLEIKGREDIEAEKISRKEASFSSSYSIAGHTTDEIVLNNAVILQAVNRVLEYSRSSVLLY